MKFKIQIPATTANIGAGFDIWAIALNLYNTFEVEVSDTLTQNFQIHYTYEDLILNTSNIHPNSLLNQSNENIIFSNYLKIFQYAGKPFIPLKIKSHIGIPISKGLGSSSSAILAGMISGNEVLRNIYGISYSLKEILNFATIEETHPDNIAAALFGGFVVNIYNEKTEEFTPVSLDFNAPVQLAGVISEVVLSTSKARDILEASYDLKTLTYQSSRTALFASLVAKKEWSEKDFSSLYYSFQDKIHQDQRAEFIIGMKDTFIDWNNKKSLGNFLSGSGSTLLSFWHQNENLSKKDLGAEYKRLNLKHEIIYPQIDTIGLTVEKIE